MVSPIVSIKIVCVPLEKRTDRNKQTNNACWVGLNEMPNTRPILVGAENNWYVEERIGAYEREELVRAYGDHNKYKIDRRYRKCLWKVFKSTVGRTVVK